MAAAPGAKGLSVPLHAVSGTCSDPRYPALAGSWVVGCSRNGAVDRALSLETGREVQLPPMQAPALGEGQIYDPGEGHIALRAPAGNKPSRFEQSRFGQRTAPPGLGPAGLAVVQDQTLDLLPAGGRVVRKIGGGRVPAPMGWQPPAISGDRAAWVVDAGRDGADIWWVLLEGGVPEPLDTGPGDQHHVVGQDHWLAWITPGGVVILDTETGAQQVHPARTGFSGGLTLWQGVACWETREGADVDIACSDGHTITGEGHQHHPSRWDRWLLYREEGTVFLHTLGPE